MSQEDHIPQRNPEFDAHSDVWGDKKLYIDLSSILKDKK